MKLTKEQTKVISRLLCEYVKAEFVNDKPFWEDNWKQIFAQHLEIYTNVETDLIDVDYIVQQVIDYWRR